ncbi:7038_t:CDS:2 [Paraglomus brasilianum]|uniref:7038_t:CDS:1 n=1 Tax=Paraglomus brasilianum TaxID=144538 RepID=A0A9N9B5C3_9GLOM|nr:7038_t:CDS:2 [Paraglomus brasilianum]
MFNSNSYTSAFILVLLTLLVFPISSDSQTVSPAPGSRNNHCAFAYQNRFYVYGGVGNDLTNSFFSYIETPFSTDKPNWVAMPVAGAANVSRPACSVTSDGILYTTGGAYSNELKFTGIQAFDLNKGTSGSWYTPKTTGLDTVKNLLYRDSHRSIVVKTSLGDEFMFIFGGEQSNDTYILNAKNLTWETVPKGPDTPPYNGLFCITSAKDNVYILGGTSMLTGTNYGDFYSDVWAFNIPTRKWFNPQISMPTVYLDGHAGKLNDTIYIVSSDSSSEKSSMRVWSLVDSRMTTFDSGPMSTVGHDYYAAAQLPGSDVLITYGGFSKASGSVATSDLAAFNMTQKTWVTLVNTVNNIPTDQFAGGPLAPGQEDPFTKSKTSNGGNGAGSGNNGAGGDSGTSSAGGTGKVIGLIAGIVAAVGLVGTGSGVLLYRWIKNKKKDDDEQLTEVKPNAAFGSSFETGSQSDSSQIYRPPKFEASGFQSEPYLVPSATTSVSSFQPPTASNHTINVNSATSSPSTLVNEIYARYKVTTIPFTSISASSISPSAPAGTLIFNRYRLNGAPAYGGNNSVRRAEDETVSQSVAIKFFSNYASFEREVIMLKYLRSKSVGEFRDLFDISNAAKWKYVMIMDYYPMSLDKFIVSRTDTMDALYVKMVVKSLAQAIHYVHSHGIVHLDIKPGNFVHENGDVTKWRLIDFEAARVNGEEDVDNCTLRYSAPEVINAAISRVGIKADMSMDIWSFGCTVYELYTRRPLFSDEQEATVRLLEAYNTGRFDLLVNRVADPQAKHVLQKLLAINPMKRVSVDEILRGAYLTGGADTAQISNMQSVSTERIINTINQNTNVVLSNMQEATNMILSQFDVIVNSISDTRDAAIPRLFMLLPGKEPHSMFKPHTWGRNTFIIHVLCEGLTSDNSEAHFTDHPGYKIFDPKPFIAKTGPYLSILATVIGSALGFFTKMQVPDTVTSTITSMSSRPTEYFKQITEIIDQTETDGDIARGLAAAQNDPVSRMKCAQGPALREFEAFLAANDPSHEFGGLYRITMSDGRWRWVCDSCRERAYHSHENYEEENLWVAM